MIGGGEVWRRLILAHTWVQTCNGIACKKSSPLVTHVISLLAAAG
jgi:hypothetical protein